MRILLLVDCYLPRPKSQAKLIHDLGVELARQGHRASVLTASDEISTAMTISDEDGLQVVRVRTPRIKGASKAVRAIHEERLSAVLWRGARQYLLGNRFDLVAYYSPTIFLGRLVARLKRMWGAGSYLILRDIFPQWAVDAGLLRKGLVWRFFRHRELQQYAAADVIGVQSPRNLEYFREELPGRCYELEVLYNWAPIGDRPEASTNLRERLGLTDETIFFYGGNIGVAQDMPNLVRLAKSFPRQARALFLLVGDGSEVGALTATIAAERMTNIRILPAVGQGEYASMLGAVDVGLITLERKLRTHNFPGKMLGYMEAGLPILASLNPGNDLAALLTEHQAGLCSWNGEDERFLQNALLLANAPDERRRLGENGRKLLERQFSASAAARQIVARWSERDA